jgi:transcriptional regulator with XRE-family HTH domain
MILARKMSIGEWLRMKRLEKGLSQKNVADLSNGVLKQSTLSAYEQNKIKDINISKLVVLGKILGFTPKGLPWELLDLDATESERIGIYELPTTADSVRLFNGSTFRLEGVLGIETDTGAVKKISEIYYQVRSAASEGSLVAKRKHPHDELVRYSNRKLNNG